MSKNNRHKIAVIIGAGPAGLTAAYELLRSTDIHPIIVECDDSIGGIARTICHNGNRMDIGGHRFFSKSDDIMQWWCNILPLQGKPSLDDVLTDEQHKTFSQNGPDPEHSDEAMLIRRRLSRILYQNKFFNYPVDLSFSTLANMGVANTLKVGFGYLYAHIFPRKESSLEDFYVNRFGKPLYAMFFKDYTQKVWGKSPKDLDADWGAQRVNSLSLASIIKNLFIKRNSDIRQKNIEKSLIDQFIYPKFGPGQLWETVAKRITDLGGEIITSAKATSISCDKDRNIRSVTIDCSDGSVKTIDCDYVISSMPIKDLIPAITGIDIPQDVANIAQNLPYRDFITIGVLVKKLRIHNTTLLRTVNNRIPDTWIYIQQPGVKMGRLQVFNNWSPYLVKDFENSVWLGLEYFCAEGDDMWTMSNSQLSTMAKDELANIGIITSEEPILDSHVERVKKAYPAYFGSYHQLPIVTKWLDTIPNLLCIGRNGQHRYNNMDHSMMTAIEAVKNVASCITSHSNVWAVNTDNDYHEAK